MVCVICTSGGEGRGGRGGGVVMAVVVAVVMVVVMVVVMMVVVGAYPILLPCLTGGKIAW